jgi:hypothetical protein
LCAIDADRISIERGKRRCYLEIREYRSRQYEHGVHRVCVRHAGDNESRSQWRTGMPERKLCSLNAHWHLMRELTVVVEDERTDH